MTRSGFSVRSTVEALRGGAGRGGAARPPAIEPRRELGGCGFGGMRLALGRRAERGRTMFQAVVLGMAGVVDLPDALRRAEIDAAAAWVARHSGAANNFRAAADPARSDWLARALPAAGLASDRRVLREIWSAVQDAVPVAENTPVREWLQPLRGSARLAVLDSGSGRRMDQWLARLGIGDWFERRLWTTDLGGDARPPRPLAFRWIASRIDVPVRDCLYVAGRTELATAARQAGWSVLQLPRPLDPEIDWDAVVAGRSPGVC